MHKTQLFQDNNRSIGRPESWHKKSIEAKTESEFLRVLMPKLFLRSARSMDVKRKLYLAFVIFSVFSTAVFAAPTLITAPVTDLYIPTGFDDNDNSEIVVAGVFPSACYKTGPSEIWIHRETSEIYIAVNAYEYEGICAQVLTPFLQTIKLGFLKAGDYTVHITHSNLTDHMSIGTSVTSIPDDYLYAPV